MKASSWIGITGVLLLLLSFAGGKPTPGPGPGPTPAPDDDSTGAFALAQGTKGKYRELIGAAAAEHAAKIDAQREAFLAGKGAMPSEREEAQSWAQAAARAATEATKGTTDGAVAMYAKARGLGNDADALQMRAKFYRDFGKGMEAR